LTQEFEGTNPGEMGSERRWRQGISPGSFKKFLLCEGVWANEHTLEECREVLQEGLEEWLLLKLRDKDPLPLIGGIDLNRMVAEG
jgi:hypothetical protein